MRQEVFGALLNRSLRERDAASEHDKARQEMVPVRGL